MKLRTLLSVMLSALTLALMMAGCETPPAETPAADASPAASAAP